MAVEQRDITTDPIIGALDALGMIDPGEFVTEAVVLFAYINPHFPGRTFYSYALANGSMPSHHLRGLIAECELRIFDSDDDGE
jgi:hypothetical protein